MIFWHRDLETARTADEVVQTARAFLASLDQRKRMALPSGVLPDTVADADAVREGAHSLGNAYWRLRQAGGEPELLQEAWTFFMRASIQLKRLEDNFGAMPHPIASHGGTGHRA